jgi:hypothetical protein
MSDLVKQLRSIDHMSVEDCFLQSYLYTKAADRIEELEAMLHLAWMDGMEAAVANILEQQARCEEQTMKLGGVEGRENDWHRWSGGDLSLGLSATTIRAQPIPTSAELLAKLKETT